MTTAFKCVVYSLVCVLNIIVTPELTLLDIVITKAMFLYFAFMNKKQLNSIFLKSNISDMRYFIVSKSPSTRAVCVVYVVVVVESLPLNSALSLSLYCSLMWFADRPQV